MKVKWFLGNHDVDESISEFKRRVKSIDEQLAEIRESLKKIEQPVVTISKDAKVILEVRKLK